MSSIIVTGKQQAARLAIIHARRIGASLVCLVASCVSLGWARAEDVRVRRVAQAPAHDMSSHNPAEPARAALPPALPEPMAAPTSPRPPDPAAVGPVAPLSLGDFERLAMERNPTLRQAFAQIDASRSRSFQAGLALTASASSRSAVMLGTS